MQEPKNIFGDRKKRKTVDEARVSIIDIPNPYADNSRNDEEVANPTFGSP